MTDQPKKGPRLYARISAPRRPGAHPILQGERAPGAERPLRTNRNCTLGEAIIAADT